MELAITVRVLRSFTLLGVALQAVVHVMQQLANRPRTHRMTLHRQLLSQVPGRLAGPPQPTHRIPTALRLNQIIQRHQQLRIMLNKRLTARA